MKLVPANDSDAPPAFELRYRSTIARVRPWPAQPGSPPRSPTTPRIAQLHVFADRGAPPADVLRLWLDTIAARGYTMVRTGATPRVDWPVYTDHGFTVAQTLVVLSHPLTWVSLDQIAHRGAYARTRRLKRVDLAAAARVDGAAFGPPWAMDRTALADTCTATPTHRGRVVRHDRQVVGFAISGVYGPSGYLQRLAVHPGHRRRGIASALVVDALAWADRRGMDQMLVNTQDINESALALYRTLGFVDIEQPLRMFERPLP